MKTPNATKSYWWAAPLAVTIGGLLIRLRGVGDFWFNADEGIYVWVAAKPTVAELNLAIMQQGHPPLYYYILRLMIHAGQNVVWLRLFSVLCGAAAVFLTYLLAREAADHLTGLFAAALIAVSPGAVMMSRVVRNYMPMIVFLLLSLSFMVRYHKERRVTDLWLCSIFLSMACFTGYASIVVVGGVLLMLSALFLSRIYGRREAAALALANLPLTATVLVLYFRWIRPATAERSGRSISDRFLSTGGTISGLPW